MKYKRNIFPKTQMFQKPVQVLDSAPKGVFIFPFIWFFGKPAPHVVRNNAPIAVPKKKHQIAIIQGPGGIAVKHQDRLSLSFVNIMHPNPVNI